MEYFFNTIYLWTRWLYDLKLDKFLYETKPGYLHVGIIMFVISFVVSALYYYMLKPVRKQMIWWFVVYGIGAITNFIVAIIYTMSPLVNNEIDSKKEWGYLDCLGFGFANIFWTFVFYVIAALILKWWSINKYVPFRKF